MSCSSFSGPAVADKWLRRFCLPAWKETSLSSASPTETLKITVHMG